MSICSNWWIWYTQCKTPLKSRSIFLYLFIKAYSNDQKQASFSLFEIYSQIFICIHWNSNHGIKNFSKLHQNLSIWAELIMYQDVNLFYFFNSNLKFFLFQIQKSIINKLKNLTKNWQNYIFFWQISKSWQISQFLCVTVILLIFILKKIQDLKNFKFKKVEKFFTFLKLFKKIYSKKINRLIWQYIAIFVKFWKSLTQNSGNFCRNWVLFIKFFHSWNICHEGNSQIYQVLWSNLEKKC